MLETKNYGRYLKFILKIVISGGAIFFVASKLNLARVWEELKDTHPLFLIMAITLYALSQVISSLRLNTMFRALPLVFPHKANLKLYWLGMFYNFFLPGGIGGDGYKVMFLQKKFRIPVKTILSTILSDRLSGLSVITAFILLFSYFIPHLLPLQQYFFLLIPIVGAGYFLFIRLINTRLTKIFLQVTGFSFLIQSIQIFVVLCLLFATGINVKLLGTEYVFLFLLSTIASAIPVTMGGIGAREFVFYTGSTYLGTNPEHAVAISLLFYLTSLINAFPGIYFALVPSSICNGCLPGNTKTASTELHRA
jgi:glycosyltransferase 2 family protein